jgi:hypothetical protein
MSARHVFFYSPGCKNCNILLGEIKDTPLQNMFIYIDVHTAKRIPSTLKGVPAIIPIGQSETNILHGKNSFDFVAALFDSYSSRAGAGTGADVGAGDGNPGRIGGAGAAASTQPLQIIDSAGPQAHTSDKSYIGNSPYEMGGIGVGYSDKYSFLDSPSAMSHRYTYVSGEKGPGVIGQSVTVEPGEAIRDSRGQTMKGKQLESDLKRLQEARSSVSNGIRRIG